MSAEHETVGVRELRQNLSVHLRRVKDGAELTVTERGHPVATLAPVRDAPLSTWDRLVAEGKIIPATRDFRDLPPPLPAGDGPSMSEVLDEIRADRI